jgi:hypothetical protein
LGFVRANAKIEIWGLFGEIRAYGKNQKAGVGMSDIFVDKVVIPKTQAMLDKHKEFSDVINNLNLDAKAHNKFVGEMVEFVSWLHVEAWKQGLEFGLNAAAGGSSSCSSGNITRVIRR